jgi:hypothetical protein
LPTWSCAPVTPGPRFASSTRRSRCWWSASRKWRLRPRSAPAGTRRRHATRARKPSSSPGGSFPPCASPRPSAAGSSVSCGPSVSVRSAARPRPNPEPANSARLPMTPATRPRSWQAAKWRCSSAARCSACRRRSARLSFSSTSSENRSRPWPARLAAGRAGRLVYDARLRLRRSLPRSVTEAFLVGAPTPSFARRVRAGMLDELVGEYRFDKRPGHRVVVRRVRDALVCEAGGQRNVLTSRRPDTLAPVEYDGEGRFRRDRRGRIRDFVYYEFGRRLGVARKLQGTKPPTTASRPPGGSPRTSRSASPTSRPRRTRSGAPPGRTHRGHPHSPPAPR